jgi:hypothetical protein
MLKEVDYRINILYADNSITSGFVSEEFNKESGKLEYIIFDRDEGIHYHFIELDKVRRIDILTSR